MPPRMPTVQITKKKPKTKTSDYPQFRNRRNNEKLRYLTLERDHYTCRMCLNPYPEKHLECDHTIPLSAGGEDNMDNTQTLCKSCHQMKTNSERNY